MMLVTFLLVCYGVTNIVTAGKLFERPRARLQQVSALLGEWVHCPMCFGFAVGVGWAALGLWPPTGRGLAVDLVAAGAASSGWCWFVRVVVHRLGGDAL